MQIIIGIIANFILYYSAGSIVLYRRGWGSGTDKITTIFNRIVVGFFAYYALFFFFCVPVMKFYRPLSLLTGIWSVVVILMVGCAVVLNLRELHHHLVSRPQISEGYIDKESDTNDSKDRSAGEHAEVVTEKEPDGGPGGLRTVREVLRSNPLPVIGILLLVALQIVLVSCTYNFTLDAAYYVAGVATNVDTNMINVYDPFTGAWQDHFEMRYFFATYSVQDAVVCQLTGISPLIWTKTVMAAVIIILTNMVYILIAGELFFKGSEQIPGALAETEASDRTGERLVTKRSLWPIFAMLLGMFAVNVTFNTIYTSSLFLMTRTYEGKAIVGNLAVVSVFYLFLLMSRTGAGWLPVFLVCFGASTISSTANMLMPVEVTVLFLPYIVRTRSLRMLPKYALCVVPGVVFSMLFVLYVKGYFVFYTYPR
ncbi:MAG: hypothetical protein IJT16_15030 [Lachnospiraceae bacterium]|nr:hypothetical protein [Lachnospiraceae bacterium]